MKRSGFFMLLAVLLHSACQVASTDDRNAAPNYSQDQVPAILEDLASRLVSDPQLSAKIVSNGNPQSVFRLRKVSGQLPDQLIIDDVAFQVSLSLLDVANVDALRKGSDADKFGIILDPDRFYSTQTEAPLKVWNGGSVEIVSFPLIPEGDNRILSADEERDLAGRKASLWSDFDFPIYSINIDRVEDDREIDRQFREMVKEQIGTFGKSFAPQNNYLTIKTVQMRSKKDDGKSELELYYGIHSNNSGRINSTTIHKFDGATRYDAAGRSVKYEDVNYNNTYTMVNDIAIWPLDGITFRMVGIEDDHDAGEFERSYGLFIYPIATTYFSMTSAGVVKLDWDYTSLGTEGSWDDVYDRSGVDDITTASLSSRLGGNSYLVVDPSSATYGQSHINWTVGLKGY